MSVEKVHSSDVAVNTLVELCGVGTEPNLRLYAAQSLLDYDKFMSELYFEEECGCGCRGC